MQDLAVVNFAPEKYSVELREIPRATIGDDEVLLEVQAVGVCGSDLHMWTGQQSWPMKYPVVLGHEFCGVIREVGARRRRLEGRRPRRQRNGGGDRCRTARSRGRVCTTSIPTAAATAR